MGYKIVRRSDKRPSPEDRLRAAMAKKPSAYQHSRQGLVVKSSNAKPAIAPPAVVRNQRGGRVKKPLTLPNEDMIGTSKKILFTGGIGDFIALESLMTNEHRNEVEDVYYATRAHGPIRSLIESSSIFPNVKKHHVVYEDWSRRFCLTSLQEVQDVIGDKAKLDDVADWSIAAIFRAFNEGRIKYEHSSILASTQADISGFDLPDNYVVICPYSPNDRRLPRDFTAQDWMSLLESLEKTQTKAVVLNTTDDYIPKHPNLVNLSMKTSLGESIEIMKSAYGYVGIDSCLSVLATKMYPVTNVKIKSLNDWLRDNGHIYYAPNCIPANVSPVIQPDCLHRFACTKLRRPRSSARPGKREITLNTVQGVGDIFWVYQLFSPHVDRINFNVLAVHDDKIQRRAEEFIELLPKAGEVDYLLASNQEYDSVARTYYKTSRALGRGWTQNFACNWPLERGIRLEDIDPGMPVEWGVELRETAFELPFPMYSILYVSGNKPQFAWSEHEWVKLVLGLRKKRAISAPIALLGASYDAPVLEKIGDLLSEFSVPTARLIDMPFSQTVYAIRNADSFVGYQSGLNILADNYNVRQVMIYFPYLKPMINAWCRPGNAENGTFNGFTFNNKIEDIISKINW